MAFAGGTVYALKGGGTDEFWTYNTSDDKWYTATQLTAGAKKVKAGGALVVARDVNALYAFRGNGTREFWKYGPIATFCPNGVLPGGTELKAIQEQTALRNPRFALRVMPNPFARMTTVSYAIPKSGNVSLSLYDVTGKLVTTLANGYTTAGNHSALVNAEQLVRGIYLLRLETNDYHTTEKLIIE
jgi:hypothetical protein